MCKNGLSCDLWVNVLYYPNSQVCQTDGRHHLIESIWYLAICISLISSISLVSDVTSPSNSNMSKWSLNIQRSLTNILLPFLHVASIWSLHSALSSAKVGISPKSGTYYLACIIHKHVWKSTMNHYLALLFLHTSSWILVIISIVS